ncbi:MAG: hypothetical protein P4L84_16045, partial [Isosphaeraceae bacterium]|nr:hypothetical protein [Isosphaeraceae bacterium]
MSATGWIDERGNPVVPTPEQLNLQIDAITRRILKEWESKRAECMAGLDRIAQHPVEGLNLNADGTPWRRPRPDGIPPELADEFRTTFLGGGVTQLASVAKLKAQFALKQ